MTASGTRQQPPGPPHRLRRRYVLRPGFQWKYTAFAVVSVFIVSELMTLLLFSVLHHQARTRTLAPAAATAWENTIVLVLSGAAFALVLGLVFGGWAILATHRVCGPLFVVESFLKDLARGRFPNRRPLRKKDEFKSFYDSFWDTLYAIKARSRRHLTAVDEAIEITRTLKNADNDARLQALKDLAMRLEAVRDELSQALGDDVQTSPPEPHRQKDIEAQSTPELANVAD